MRFDSMVSIDVLGLLAPSVMSITAYAAAGSQFEQEDSYLSGKMG